MVPDAPSDFAILPGRAGPRIININDAVLLCCLRARLGSMAKRFETKWNRIGAGGPLVRPNLRHSGPKAAKIAGKGLGGRSENVGYDVEWRAAPDVRAPNERGEMRHFLTIAAVGAVVLAASAFAPAHSQTRPAAPTKREACKVDAKSLRGASQDKVDQYQLCMAQARTDCLKDAIVKKIVGAERKEFVKTCIGPRDDDAL
jgi:hypothetical protein